MPDKTPAMHALEIVDLRKVYANGLEALKGVALRVEQGDFFALLGPNGAGKSTIIGIVSSLVNKTSGTINIYGYDTDIEPEMAKSCIGVVPQEFNFNMFEKVEDIIVNQAGYYGIPRAQAKTQTEHYLRKLRLWEKRRERSRDLSGGMKRRLMIARALVHEPRLLILDEPTAGVDIEIRRSMWAFLREINEAGTTIILTTHYLEEAESLCENIAIIDHGLIIEDTDMKTLLNKLHVETFVLDIRTPLSGVPETTGYDMRLRNSTTLEVDVDKDRSLNSLFSELSRCGVEVLSLRNKTNRLEELFIHMIDKNGSPRPDEA